MSTLLLLLLFVLAWVLLILPKQRELKRHNALVASLEVGDEVMSGSGIYGTITAIDGDVVMLQIAPDIEIKVARRAVAAKVAEPGAGAITGTTVDEIDLTDEAVDGDASVGELPSVGDDDTDGDDPDWPGGTSGSAGRV